MKTKYVIGYYIDKFEAVECLNENLDDKEQVAAFLKEYGNYSSQEGGDLIFGVCRVEAIPGRFAEIKDGESYISLAQIRDIEEKMYFCFPKLNKRNRVIKEYIYTQN